MMQFVSVVICTYNRRKLFDECLLSLFNQSYPKDSYEIVVVDSSDDVNDDLIRSYIKIARNNRIMLNYIYQRPKGLATARNLGIKHAEGDIICFIDDDCIADRYWIENLVKAFDSRDVGGVGGKIIPFRQETLIERFANNYFNQEYLIKTQSFVIGCNMAYRKDVLELVNGFDELFKYGADDNDIGFRVRLKGYRLRYAPDAIVYHKHRTTFRGLLKQQYHYGRGHAKLGKKYVNYPKWQLATSIGAKVVWIVASMPLSIFDRNRLTFKALSIVSSISFLLGLINGILFEKYPEDRKIHDDLSFLQDYIKKTNIIGKIKSKIK